ncbi:fungal hydrophobin [Peniophora sp. CONT]|nr:fungal hydrophobin [Peniophora sp. CONT]
MFARVFTVLALAAAVVAAPTASCNSGALQCCQSAGSKNLAGLGGLLDLIPIDLQGLNIPIGLTCTPINVLSIGGNTCQQQTVCCENNTFNGVVALGCSPIGIPIA